MNDFPLMNKTDHTLAMELLFTHAKMRGHDPSDTGQAWELHYSSFELIIGENGVHDVTKENGWYDLLYVRITRPLLRLVSKSSEQDTMRIEQPRDYLKHHEEVSEDTDDQTIQRNHEPGKPQVVYEIHYHPSYQVPVLYFFLRDMPDNECDLDAVYRHVVDGGWEQALICPGIMGGISMTEHPVTNEPCFFVHPCRTADALYQILGTEDCTFESYLQAWFGIIATPLGLRYPMNWDARSS